MQFLQQTHGSVAKTKKHLTRELYDARIQSIKYVKCFDGDKYLKISVAESGGWWKPRTRAYENNTPEPQAEPQGRVIGATIGGALSRTGLVEP